jgi:hypothetical protein
MNHPHASDICKVPMYAAIQYMAHCLSVGINMSYMKEYWTASHNTILNDQLMITY